MLEKYKQATPRSQELWERVQNVFPGGVCHNIRTFCLDRCDAYPPIMKRGEGSRIWDIDGNEYVDWWMTHFSMILGHNNPEIREAIQAQLLNGNHFGALNEPQVIFGEKLQEAIPRLAKMRFTSTGSEATAYSVRLARLFTQKNLIAKARGGWHGGNAALGYHIVYPFSDDPFFNGVSFEFNDRDSVDNLLKKHGKELAAIVIEPVLGAGGGLAPTTDFLPYLREETEKRDILLIFDEIITGFRLCYGSGGINYFGVEPDLLTLGKIAAGGMPLGVYGGREDVMALAAPGAEGGRWVGGGTFSGHPLTMIAGIATLNKLQSLKNEYNVINKQGETLCKKINTLFENEQTKAIATGIGSMIFIHMLQREMREPPITGRQLGEVLDHKQLDIFQSMLIEQGVFGYHGLGALSFTHTEQDLERTLSAVTTVIENMD